MAMAATGTSATKSGAAHSMMTTSTPPSTAASVKVQMSTGRASKLTLAHPGLTRVASWPSPQSVSSLSVSPMLTVRRESITMTPSLGPMSLRGSSEEP